MKAAVFVELDRIALDEKRSQKTGRFMRSCA
jgi:hypothetical protein